MTLLSTLWRTEIKDKKAANVEDVKGSRFLSGSFMLSGSLEVLQLRKQLSKESFNKDPAISRFRTESMNSDVSYRRSYDSLNLPNTKKLKSGHYLTVPENVVNENAHEAHHIYEH